jgi:hypothetical protein
MKWKMGKKNQKQKWAKPRRNSIKSTENNT